ncbi:MAG: thiamine kinase [Glaciecola sp.]|jgi:thiamine kinase|uniref:choline/ethanolamine kinase family protein n=1 Tax=Congregibacter sp. TaxID=2744308 RepID=UPI0039E3197F
MEAVAEQLAPSRRHIVEEVCRNFSRWAPQLQCPPIPGEMLQGGYNHHVQLIEGSTQRWVLRIDKRSRDNAQRELELAIQTQAAAHNIAPRIDYGDPKSGVTVMEWIDGQQDTQNRPAALAQLLRNIHVLRPRGKPVESIDVLQDYRTAIAPQSPLAELVSAENPRIDKAMNDIVMDGNVDRVLCHNDLLCANRLQGKSHLYALDWEYAAPGDPLFDLAVCASELRQTAATQLLALYLQRRPTQAEERRFSAQCLIYACIEACWFSIYHANSDQTGRSHKNLERMLLRGASR